jgi:hypothetical protein
LIARRQTIRRALLAVAACLAAAPAPGGAAAAEPAGADTAARPEPPRSADLRARTPAGGEVAAQDHLGRPTPLPSGGRVIFPDHRVVSLYGAPQMGATILGRLSPFEAGRLVRREASRYAFRGAKPRVRAFELVVSIATSDAGRDGLYRFRQPSSTIARYLKAARAANARLILDIQPGRSPFPREVRAIERWLREPDVDLALDPEWNVGPRGRPGRTDGSGDGSEVNEVAGQIARIVRARRLPQKLLIVHQFREASVTRESRIRRGENVATTLSFDGIGPPREKRAGYEALSSPRLFNGFCLFYRRDEPLMSPTRVVQLNPRPLYVMYQ